ncbi:MAG: hypothetical protein KAT68_12805, partial [Bacteroidales bacterium]|nr:hypothetical protein [Bacteroidales bacterium]
MKKVILLFTISLFFMMGSKGYAQESLENFLVNTTFTWIDNGKTLGTTTFTTDGIAHPTWSDLHHTWKLEANNDLLVSANGTQYVARLKWNSTSKSFSGERDVTSQIQDGVKTVMKEVEESPENFLVNTTFTWIDNGKTLGTTTFTTDGVAHPTWTTLPNIWKLEANNDLLIFTNGTQYVARLKWNSASQSFSGERDV